MDSPILSAPSTPIVDIVLSSIEVDQILQRLSGNLYHAGMADGSLRPMTLPPTQAQVAVSQLLAARVQAVRAELAREAATQAAADVAGKAPAEPANACAPASE